MGQAETRPSPGSREKVRAQKSHCLLCNRKLWYLERWKHQTLVGKGGGVLRLRVCNVILMLLLVSPLCQTWCMEKCPGATGGASSYQLRPLALPEGSDMTAASGRGIQRYPPQTGERRRYFISRADTHTGNGLYCTKTHARTHWTSAPSTVNTLVYVTLPPHHLPKWSVLIKVLLWSTVTKMTAKMHPAELTDRKTGWIFLFSSCGYDNWVFNLLVYCKYPSLVCLKTRINFMILI